LPNYEMPSYAYGSELENILKELNLDGVEELGVSHWVNYTLRGETPISIPADSLFFGSYQLNLRQSYKESLTKPGIILQDGFIVSFNLDGETFDIDFEQIFESLNLIGGNDSNDPISVPVQTIDTNSQKKIRMIVLSGNFAENGNNLNSSGNIEVAFIVPNAPPN